MILIHFILVISVILLYIINLFSSTARSMISSISEAVKHLGVPRRADHQVAQGSLRYVPRIAKPVFVFPFDFFGVARSDSVNLNSRSTPLTCRHSWRGWRCSERNTIWCPAMREVERQPPSWCPSRPPGGSPPGGDYDYDEDGRWWCDNYFYLFCVSFQTSPPCLVFGPHRDLLRSTIRSLFGIIIIIFNYAQNCQPIIINTTINNKTHYNNYAQYYEQPTS